MLLFFGIGVPLSLITAFIAADTRIDLSNLRAKTADAPSEPVTEWSALLELDSPGEHPPLPGSIVTMFGYMMKPTASDPHLGSRVRMFTLLPDAGRVLHPAHRDPDQMVSIWLRQGTASVFRDRTLVCVRGRFEHTSSLTGAEPLYALRDATAHSASLADIHSRFGRSY